MRALRLHGDRDLRIDDIDSPGQPGPGEVLIRVRAVGLNHIDVWGYRGMAFAKRKLPLAVARRPRARSSRRARMWRASRPASGW